MHSIDLVACFCDTLALTLVCFGVKFLGDLVIVFSGMALEFSLTVKNMDLRGKLRDISCFCRVT